MTIAAKAMAEMKMTGFLSERVATGRQSFIRPEAMRPTWLGHRDNR
ncbi:hypothetical protein SAMN04488093_11635 [Tropicibacter naphthalenivorans]|uniref:Uncharacterized protein n=1 Tax=Tropicibacter naphthalenivorans TaxID=441103 RepID=A0A0P1GYE5_9RHOB|nr:hypothetical protein TRN7648_03741 [Tropicibacter naphthalenivorans]SMD07891.1 hypothetical protein SAMN04488093_11635 [Tropicibacter naphthalenivorans]